MKSFQSHKCEGIFPTMTFRIYLYTNAVVAESFWSILRYSLMKMYTKKREINTTMA